eukprot:COSAG01_NODE_25658_length_737_cov_118.388715_1_plen_132_part_01
MVDRIDGAVTSTVTPFAPGVTLDMSVPALPTKSAYTISNDAMPSSVPDTTGNVALQLVPLPATAAAPPATVTLGAPIASLAVIATVIVSPAFASEVSPPLFDVIDTTVSVGALRSIDTLDPSVTALTAMPAL